MMPTFFKSKISITLALALLSAQAAWAADFVVRDIRVEGAQRIEAGTIFSYMGVRAGDTFTDEKSQAAIKSLYASGLFKDVRIDTDKDVLVVIVEERPAIAAVELSGTKEFEREPLLKTLKDAGLGEARIYDKAVVEKAEQELKKLYLTKGLYGVQITTTVTPIERNRVNVAMVINEGKVAKIKEIKIIGNKAFSEKEVLAVMSSNSGGLLSWYTKSDQYSKQKITNDIEAIKSFYLNRGYVEFEIESSQITISPDKQEVFVSVTVREGEQYKISEVKIEGETYGKQAELLAGLTLKNGDIYSAEKMAESTRIINERLGALGYAFVNVNPVPTLNKAKKEVAYTIQIDPGKRVYVRRVNIAGNVRTRDEVIRRELRQFESGWYDSDKILLSRNRLDRLGYFKEVAVDTQEVSGTNDQVDLNIKVTEKPTGNINFGAGFSSTDKLTFNAGINQSNIFGSGKTLGLDMNTGKTYRTVALSMVDPYFTNNGTSLSNSLYYRTTRPPVGSTGDYKIVAIGADARVGIPFTELDTVYFGIGYERNVIDLTDTSPGRFVNYVNTFGRVANSVPLSVSWQRDSRDSFLTPNSGRYQRFNFDVTAPVTDLRFIRGVYQHQYFYPVTSGITFATNGEIDYGRGFAGKPYPVFKNFYAGGIGSVRGFEASSLGPRDTNGDSLGGAMRLIANAEILFPFPGADRSIRWFTYYDIGNVFDEKAKIKFSDLRMSAGVGLSWASPLGPLKFSFGRALNAKEGDRKQAFQFQIGTGF